MNQDQQIFLAKMAFDKRSFSSAVYALFAVIVLTLLNMVMIMSGNESYMIFSAYMPYQFVVTGLFLSGRLQIEGVDAPVSVSGDAALYIAIAIAVAILAAYLILTILAKKFYGCLIAGTALFGIDTLFLLFSLGTSAMIDLVFHALILVTLIRGCASAKRYFQAIKYLEFMKNNSMGAAASTQPKAPDNEYFGSSENGYFKGESSYFPPENAPQNQTEQKSDKPDDSDKDI